MAGDSPIREGQILTGPLFSEPMRVETIRQNGTTAWDAGMVGLRSERFRRVTLTAEEIESLTIADTVLTYDGDARQLRLGLQAYALGIAYEFDPYFGLSISRVDPLPHQLEAVYDYFLKLPTIRFLLADDAGAGKTIMAGLLVRELKLRGLVERVLVVCPANLAFQWQRELKEKFDEQFIVFKGSDIRDQFGVNQWLEQKQVVTSLDLAKREDILPGLRQVHWDLVIVDEAHRMSARDETHKSQRYRLGEMLRDNTDHVLHLTATPHKGDPQNFTLFLQLLDRDAYADVKSIQEAMDRQRAPFYLRRTKEAMVYFPERLTDGEWAAKPVFTKRIPRTASFKIDGDELELYQEITRFVKRQSARAAAQEDDPRARAVGFTENAAVARALLADLVERGLPTERSVLFVIDGAKALRRAIAEVYGERAAVQRCQVHKRRNVLAHLPEHQHAQVARCLHEAFESESAGLGERRLHNLARSLERDHPGAAASVREGLHETLTVVRLGLTGALHRTLRSTNAIENLNGSVERYTRNVKRWRGGEMIQRWVSAALLDAEQRFRRVRGFRDMPRLMLALDDPSARFKQPGMAA